LFLFYTYDDEDEDKDKQKNEANRTLSRPTTNNTNDRQ
jgi:hypothetical protein